MRADSGRCSSCGAHLPRAAGWCPSCGAAQGGALEVVDLTAEGQRPPPTTGVVERRRRRPPIAAFVALGAVAVLVAAGSLLGGADDDGDDGGGSAPERSRAAPTTIRTSSTPDRQPTGAGGADGPTTDRPLLGEPTGLELVGIDRDGVLVAVDLDTGVVTTLSEPAFGQSRYEPLNVFAVGGAVVVVDIPNHRVTRVDAGQVAAPISNTDEREQLVISTDRRSMWIVDAARTSAHEIDLGSGAPIEGHEVDVPPGTFVAGARPDGLLLQSQTGGVYLLAPGTAPRQLADGLIVAASNDHLAVLVCDEALVCRIEAGERGASLQVASRAQETGRFSPDGRWLAVPVRDGSLRPGEIVLLDLATGATIRSGIYLTTPSLAGSALAWSPDSRWMLAPSGATAGAFFVVDVLTGVRHTVDLSDMELQALADLRWATAPPAHPGTPA